MLLRPRPDGSAAALRMTAVLPARAAGWVPPDPPELLDVDRSGVDDGRRSGSQALPDLPYAPCSPDAPDPPGRSWASPVPGAPLAAGPRYRLGADRRGTVALVLLGLLAALSAGVFALRDRPREVALPDVEIAGLPLPGAPSAAPAPGAEVVVAVAGKVRKPGLLRLPAGSRVDDAVRAAGGATPGADLTLLNLARRLVDGEQVLVGVDGAVGAPGGGAAAGGLLDLNSASASDLDALPGIGPVLAQRIVDWRAEHGRFASVDQLREVTGIGEAKYSDLEAKVTV